MELHVPSVPGDTMITSKTQESTHSPRQFSYLHLNCSQQTAQQVPPATSAQVSLCSLSQKGARCLLSIFFCQHGSLKYFFFCPRVIMSTIESSYVTWIELCLQHRGNKRPLLTSVTMASWEDEQPRLWQERVGKAELTWPSGASPFDFSCEDTTTALCLWKEVKAGSMYVEHCLSILWGEAAACSVCQSFSHGPNQRHLRKRFLLLRIFKVFSNSSVRICHSTCAVSLKTSRWNKPSCCQHWAFQCLFSPPPKMRWFEACPTHTPELRALPQRRASGWVLSVPSGRLWCSGGKLSQGWVIAGY